MKIIPWPFSFLFIVLLLNVIGVMMLYSAAGGEWSPWAKQHAIRGLAGWIGMVIIAFIPIRTVMNKSWLFYLACVGLLVAVMFMGHMGMGARRWLDLGVFHLQPSEPAKIAVILMIARYYHRVNHEQLGRVVTLVPPLLIVALPAAFILLQPNLGTATITAMIGALMMFAAGVRWRYIVGAVVALAAAAPVLWQFLKPYQQQRVLTFLDPLQDPLGAGYNIMQSRIAIGSGGLFGKGFVQGSQSQLQFLPEKHTDFIFTMLAEEWGFAGGLLLLLLYAGLLLHGYSVALSCRHHFGRMVAYGITCYFFVHIVINMGMVMGLLPVVGVPLPFLSYGGSMQLTAMLASGVLLNMYRHHREKLPRLQGF